MFLKKKKNANKEPLESKNNFIAISQHEKQSE